MKIDAKANFAGVPILELRRLLRRSKNIYAWNIFFIIEVLDVCEEQAAELAKALENEGFIEKAETKESERYWTNTVKGNALAIASAAKPLRRESADKKLTEFIARVKQVNESSYFLYKVEKVVVFGSYLSSEDKIGDIDLAVTLAAKAQDREEAWRLNKERTREACEQGRQFSNIIDELFWPQREVFLMLKNRSRSFSIHSPDDLQLAKTSKVIFEEKT